MSISTHLSRRKFIALTGAAAAQAAASSSLLYGVPTPPVAPRAGVQSLAGQWRFSLDRDDAGVKEAWFASDLHATTTIALPGILQTQGYGDDIVADTQFIAALPRDMGWYKLPQYAAYTKPGAVEVPYLSQPVKHYLGVAWYQRDIDIPAAWRDKRVGLTLERTRWVTTVYVDDKEMGTNRSLVAPHDCDLGILTPGKHRLSIRIDNSMQQPAYRFDGHSVSDAEGSTWNGIVGRIELAATSPVWIDDAQVFPNVEGKSAHIKVRIGNATVMPGDAVFGDPEGVYFIPPSQLKDLIDEADVTHIHDEWTKKKFEEGKYISTDIYGSPHDPALIKEYQDYLKEKPAPTGRSGRRPWPRRPVDAVGQRAAGAVAARLSADCAVRTVRLRDTLANLRHPGHAPGRRN